MYVVRNSQGDIVAFATRKQDAQAMTQTIGSESPKEVDIQPN